MTPKCLTRTTGKTELLFAEEKTGGEMVGDGEKNQEFVSSLLSLRCLVNIEEEISRKQFVIPMRLFFRNEVLVEDIHW